MIHYIQGNKDNKNKNIHWLLVKKLWKSEDSGYSSAILAPSPRPQTLEFFSLRLDSAQAPGSILQPLTTVTSLSFFDPLVKMQAAPLPNPSPPLYSLASHGKGGQRTKFSPVSERDVCGCHLFKKKIPCSRLLLLPFWWARILIGEGNGTPPQYSCLENPMDGGAW